jgi:hypothetical protein
MAILRSDIAHFRSIDTSADLLLQNFDGIAHWPWSRFGKAEIACTDLRDRAVIGLNLYWFARIAPQPLATDLLLIVRFGAFTVCSRG